MHLSADGIFRDGSHANITIRLYGKLDQFAKFKHANISNFTVSEIRVILTTCDSRMKVFMPSMDPDYFRTCPKEEFVMFQ